MGLVVVVVVALAAASATHSALVGSVVQSMHPTTLGAALQVTASLLFRRQAARTKMVEIIVADLIVD